MRYHDYEEFIAALNAHGARYLVVGAHAVAFHGRPRATRDLDLWIEPSEENAQRVLAALSDFFGGADRGYSSGDLTSLELILQLGVAPVRIDLLKTLAGLGSFAEAWANRVTATYGEVHTAYLAREDLIRAKRAADRLQDRADVRFLERIAARERRR
jgi:hypothetical protein